MANQIATLSSTTFIRNPRILKIEEEMRQCHELSLLTAKPSCLLLQGPSGVGKTHMALDYAASFPKESTSNNIRIPVLYTEVPSPASIQAIQAALLKKLDDPTFDSGTTIRRNYRLIKMIRDCGVELIILDEFSNLIDPETNRVLLGLANWLKLLIIETKVPVVAIGIDRKTEAILNSDPQLASFFMEREVLEPFDFSTPDQIVVFKEFVEGVINNYAMTFSSEMPLMELLQRIFYATDGVAGNVKNLILYATQIAQEKHDPMVDYRHLSEAFDRRISRYLSGKTNPF